MKNVPYSERAKLATDPFVQRLWRLMHEKQSNLCVSADVTQADELVTLVERVASQVAVVKTHIDIINDFTPALTKELRKLADHYQFMIFEDRKFADIGNTVKQQCAGGVYKIAQWADIINAHILPGWGIIEGLRAAMPHGALLLLAELSSEGHFCDEAYQANCVKLAERYPEFVKGFICQHRLTNNPNLLNFTPGVNLESSGDGFGQQYRSPAHVINQCGADLIIVGRGITEANDVTAAAERYRQAGWQQ